MKYFALAAALSLLSAAVPSPSGAMPGMDHKSMAKEHTTQATHRAFGVVKSADAKAGSVLVAHEPVGTLKWPAMTMSFRVADPTLLPRLAPGQKVEFEFQQRGRDYVITGVR